MDKKYTLNISIVLIIIVIFLISLIVIYDKRVVSDLFKLSDKNKNKISYLNTKTLKSIIIFRLPNKIYYKEGEIFDKTGMIVKGIFNDKTETYINDYIIDKNLPLTIYDSIIKISYEGKTSTFNIIIINDEQLKIYPNPSEEKYTLELKEGITRFEIEDSDLSKWIISNKDEDNKIIERNDASRKTFLSGIDENSLNEGKLIFNLTLNFNAEIIMSVSYSQNEKWKNYDIDISEIYTFLIDENKNIRIDGENILYSREDITK